MTSKLIQLLSDQHNPNLSIVDEILYNIGIAGIFALHATCKRLRWLVRHMTDSPYLLNINKHLQKYSKDPTRFRYELGKCDGLMAGSFVLNFITFGSSTSPRLDIYINKGAQSLAFMRYLKNDEGYGEYRERHDRYLYTHKTHSDVSILILTRSTPIINIIAGANTPADLMFISWNKVYCPFPLPTIKRQKFFRFWLSVNYKGRIWLNYAAAGWRRRGLIQPKEAPELAPQGARRYIGHQGPLIINLGNSPKGEFTPDHVLENDIFSNQVFNNFEYERFCWVLAARLIP